MDQRVIEVIHQYMDTFFGKVSTKYKINVKDLKQIWNDINVVRETITKDKDEKKKTKKSAYQNFFALKITEIKKTEPSRSFGELSTHISKLWNQMSKAEQSQYVSTDSDEKEVKKSVKNDKSVPVSVSSIPSTIIIDDLEDEDAIVTNKNDNYKRTEIEDEPSIVDEDDEDEIDFDDVLDEMDDD